MSELLKKYFPDISADQVEKLAALKPLYTGWNQKINVISRKDIEFIEMHHILHSLSIARVISFIPGSAVLDAGTGGGFPGIPLAILFPGTTFTLVDSIGKKMKVVREIAGELELRNIIPVQKRFEGLTGRYDFILGRAVSHVSGFFHQLHHLVQKKEGPDLRHGILYLSGPEVIPDLRGLKTDLKIYQLSAMFEEEWFTSKILIHLYNF